MFNGSLYIYITTIQLLYNNPLKQLLEPVFSFMAQNPHKGLDSNSHNHIFQCAQKRDECGFLHEHTVIYDATISFFYDDT